MKEQQQRTGTVAAARDDLIAAEVDQASAGPPFEDPWC
jgi:hypothetical protein